MNGFSEIKKDLVKYFLYFWLLTGIGLLISPKIPTEVVTILTYVLIGMIAIQFIFSFFTLTLMKSLTINSIISLLLGICLYSNLKFYFGELGSSLFISVVIAAIITFCIVGYIGAKIEKDLSGMFNYLWVMLLGIIIFTIVFVLIGIPFESPLYTLLAAAGFGVFSVYTLVEFNAIAKGKFQEANIPVHVMGYSLYINLLNMILDLLRIVWAIYRR